MSVEQDVARAREAVDHLEEACGLVVRHHGESLDARRLRVDLARVRDDLDLLAHARVHGHGQPSAAATWGDYFDEGIGAPARTRP
jgi:hypothetical protein